MAKHDKVVCEHVDTWPWEYAPSVVKALDTGPSPGPYAEGMRLVSVKCKKCGEILLV